MSKKTKKQKILAELRRQKQKIMTVSDKAGTDIKKAFTPAQQLRTDPNQTQSIYSYPVHLIKKDLTKTLLLCILAISFEIALFFFFQKNISLPFKK